MNRESFINEIWTPYPDGNSISEQYSCLRFKGDLEERPGLEEVCKDALLGASCPASLLKEGDWVAWCPSRKVYFLLAPQLREKPLEAKRDPKKWNRFLNSVRSFFQSEKFQEILTPLLVTSPGVDHHIDFFKVKGTRTGREWTLPTSPEIHLKKHLCQGYEKIFEIKPCFRDDLPGENHTAEFTMLEWYRAFVPLQKISEDLNSLLQELKPGLPEISNMSVAQVFLEKTGKVLTPQTSSEELKSWACELGIDHASDDDWNDLFFRIFMEEIEPTLGLNGPVLLWNYPSQQASLAKISAEGWAQRFELYWNGIELANAYLEVNDPGENKQRFLNEANLRRASHSEASPMDDNFFQWMEYGMPPASGIALGLDRLFKLIH